MILTALFTVAIIAAPPARGHAKLAGPDGGVAGVICQCEGDIDGNGAVDASDLSLMLGQWGLPGASDLNDDELVDAADLSILLGAWGACPSAPQNDLCSDAQLIGEGQQYFCTSGANADGPNPGPNSGCNVLEPQIDHDVWFAYASPGDGTLTVSTCNFDWDTQIAVYGSIIPGLFACPSDGLSFAVLLGCSDDEPSCGLGSKVSIAVQKGNVYTIRVGGFIGWSGDGLLDVDYLPDGALCGDAIPIANADSATILGMMLDKVATEDLDNCAPGDVYSTWYSFEQPCSWQGADMTISTCNPGTDFDTVVTVWREGLQYQCAETLIACNDDSPVSGCQIGGINRRSYVTFHADPGWTYYIQVSGYQAAAGDYELTVTSSCP